MYVILGNKADYAAWRQENPEVPAEESVRVDGPFGMRGLAAPVTVVIGAHAPQRNISRVEAEAARINGSA